MEFIRGTAFGNELGAAFYDGVYSNDQGEYSLVDFRRSIYYPLYCRSLESLVRNQSKAILEIGCGVGHFAQLLHRTGKFEYTGFDFSEVAVQKAKNKAPDFNFSCQDVYTTDLFETSDYDSAVVHEVLEHIEDDLLIICKIKAGTFISASVPNFDSRGHVRYFENAGQVFNRYSSVIDNLKIENISYNNSTSVVFLLSGIVK